MVFYCGNIVERYYGFPDRTGTQMASWAFLIIPANILQWTDRVYEGVRQTNQSFPFLAYGTDWLTFAHLIIAMLFIGVLNDPVKINGLLNGRLPAACLVFLSLIFSGI